MTLVNYLLLALAAWQFPFIFWLSNVPVQQTLALLLSAAKKA